MNQKLTTAKQFGTYLDDDNFKAVVELLALNCEYEIGEKLLTDRETIVKLYQDNMEEGHKKFDKMVWGKSRVEEVSEGVYEVFFSDFLTHKGKTHNYKCKQRLDVNEDNLIVRITHIELEGEREKLDSFYEEVGLK